MSSDPVLKYSHHTLVMQPLKTPEIRARKNLITHKRNASARYLQDRPGGFIFIRWLKNDARSLDVVGLFASVDRPQELVVIKKLRSLPRADQAADSMNAMAPEVEISTLDDPLVRRQLPLHLSKMGQAPFPELHAVQLHNRGKPADEYEGFHATVFCKYYNGGTLYDLLHGYENANRPVPEGFIWHFLAEVGRAYAYLHTGAVPSRKYNLKHRLESGFGQRETAIHTHKSVPGWEAICHIDGHADNVWLHYPTDEEKKANPDLERFTDELPQIILGDFGYAFEAKHDRNDMLLTRKNRGMPEPATTRDKGEIGSGLFRLLVPAAPEEHRTQIMDCFEKPGEATPPEWQLKRYIEAQYSSDLVDCYDQFKTLASWAESRGIWSVLLQTSTERDWARWPTNDFVYGTMIAMADDHVDLYAQSSQKESVRWTQPTRACMPYHAMDRSPYHHRGDWRKVDEHLMSVMQDDFQDYSLQTTQIWQAHILGSGKPVKELEQVECDFQGLGPDTPEPESPKPPKPPKPPRPGHGPDSLPDYESSGGGGDKGPKFPAKRAALVSRQKRLPHASRVRISSPPTPPEFRRHREQYMEVYRRNRRQRLREEAARRGRRLERELEKEYVMEL